MSRRPAALALWLTLLAVPAGTVSAQQRQLGRILGVFDDATGQPIAGVQVEDISTHTTAVTSESGAVTLAFLEPGTTMLQLRKLGYVTRLLPVSVSAADTTSITVILKPVGQTLPEVVTKAAAPATGKLAEFERRRASGFGHFLAQPEIEKMDGHLTSDLFRRIPGINLFRSPRPGSVWYIGASRTVTSFLRQGGSGMCLAAVMVDGHMAYSGVDGQEPFDINSIRPEEISAIEYYAGGATMPTELNATRNTCGLVVIWTR